MKAIILAAGLGKRLQDASNGLPKTMIRIGESSIIHRQIDSCLEIGIRDFVFVLGFKKEIVKEHILNKIGDLNPKFIINPIFDKTNTLYSLWLTKKEMNDDFIYFNADVVYDKKLLIKLTDDSQYSQLLVETKKCSEEEVKVIINDDMHILEIGKKLDVNRCAGEFIGIARFKKKVIIYVIKSLQTGVDQGYSNSFFEYAVNKLTDKHILLAVPTAGFNCLEIDFPEDLEKARKIFSKI